MNVRIVPMDASHLDALAQIEQECFSLPWSRSMLEEELYNDCAAFLVAEDEQGAVLGYAGLQVVLDEGYIANVVVRPGYRRRHIAQQLLDVYLRFAQAHHLAFLTLEVRPSNKAAVALYRKYGFIEEGRRRNYYQKPKEDALIMTRRFHDGTEIADT